MFSVLNSGANCRFMVSTRDLRSTVICNSDNRLLAHCHFLVSLKEALDQSPFLYNNVHSNWGFVLTVRDFL